LKLYATHTNFLVLYIFSNPKFYSLFFPYSSLSALTFTDLLNKSSYRYRYCFPLIGEREKGVLLKSLKRATMTTEEVVEQVEMRLVSTFNDTVSEVGN
jgi:hypothetical protein